MTGQNAGTIIRFHGECTVAGATDGTFTLYGARSKTALNLALGDYVVVTDVAASSSAPTTLSIFTGDNVTVDGGEVIISDRLAANDRFVARLGMPHECESKGSGWLLRLNSTATVTARAQAKGYIVCGDRAAAGTDVLIYSETFNAFSNGALTGQHGWDDAVVYPVSLTVSSGDVIATSQAATDGKGNLNSSALASLDDTQPFKISWTGIISAVFSDRIGSTFYMIVGDSSARSVNLTIIPDGADTVTISVLDPDSGGASTLTVPCTFGAQHTFALRYTGTGFTGSIDGVDKVSSTYALPLALTNKVLEIDCDDAGDGAGAPTTILTWKSIAVYQPIA